MKKNEINYAVVVRHNPKDARLFGRIVRKDKGDVIVAWQMTDDHTSARVPSWNPHSSYHQSGRSHSKSYNRASVIKQRQKPDPSFKGREQVEATNADRMLSTLFPYSPDNFDGAIEIPIEMVSGKQNQFLSVDLVEPGIDPIRLTGQDKVLLEAIFKDSIPWIVVTFGEAGEIKSI